MKMSQKKQGYLLIITASREPDIADPLVVHVSISEGSARGWGSGGTGKGDHLLDGQPQLESMKRVGDPDLPLDLSV